MPMVMGKFDTIDAASAFEIDLINQLSPPCNSKTNAHYRSKKLTGPVGDWGEIQQYKPLEKAISSLRY